jgi:hypothetical protein
MFGRVKNVTINEKIILHLSRFIKTPDVMNMPYSSTQDGIAMALGISRAHSSLELKKLVEQGKIGKIHAHIRGRCKRLTYYLEPEGIEYAKALKRRLDEEKIDFDSLFIDIQANLMVKKDPNFSKAENDICIAVETMAMAFENKDKKMMVRAAMHLMDASKNIIKVSEVM